MAVQKLQRLGFGAIASAPALFPDRSQELLLKLELKEDWDDQLVVPASTESFAVSALDETVANAAG